MNMRDNKSCSQRLAGSHDKEVSGTGHLPVELNTQAPLMVLPTPLLDELHVQAPTVVLPTDVAGASDGIVTPAIPVVDEDVTITTYLTVTEGDIIPIPTDNAPPYITTVVITTVSNGITVTVTNAPSGVPVGPPVATETVVVPQPGPSDQPNPAEKTIYIVMAVLSVLLFCFVVGGVYVFRRKRKNANSKSQEAPTAGATLVGNGTSGNPSRPGGHRLSVLPAPVPSSCAYHSLPNHTGDRALADRAWNGMVARHGWPTGVRGTQDEHTPPPYPAGPSPPVSSLEDAAVSSQVSSPAPVQIGHNLLYVAPAVVDDGVEPLGQPVVAAVPRMTQLDGAAADIGRDSPSTEMFMTAVYIEMSVDNLYHGIVGSRSPVAPVAHMVPDKDEDFILELGDSPAGNQGEEKDDGKIDNAN